MLKFPEFFKEVNYVLVTEFREMLFLPFLAKLVPSANIIITNLAYQLGRIALESFHETLSEFDATCEELTFFTESENMDKYEEDMDAILDNWRKLYSKEDISYLLGKVVKVNYYEVLNTDRGVLLRCLPSGKNNGSGIWELQSVETHQKILLVNELAQFKWKTCMPYNLQRLKQEQAEEPYQLVIFTKKAIDAYSEGEETNLGETVRRINNNASMGVSTTVVLEDTTLCIDLIPRLTVQPEGRVRAIILGHQSLHSLHNYVNSYVDYLSKYYRDQIFAETPDYPLIHYSKLRSKGLLSIGSL